MIDTGHYNHGMSRAPAVSSQVDRRRQQQQQYGRCSDDELTCKICLTVYSQRSPALRPRTLHCQHTFCESCLQHLLTGDRGRQRKGQAERSPDSVKCPLCKYRTFLGPTFIQGLPVNSEAIKHSGQTSSLRSMHYGRQLYELPPRCAVGGVGGKGNAKMKGNTAVHFMSCGTTGNRVLARKFENFHPPPRDDGDLWELSRSHGRTLRFADEDDQLSPSFDHDHGGDFTPAHDHEQPTVDHRDEVLEDMTPIAVLVGQFGQYEEAPGGHLGTFRSPSSIDCARDGRLAVVDADSGSVQMFTRNGECLSSFHVVGARAACFIEDAARGESLAVATCSGVSVCDQTGRVDKHLPIGSDLLAVAALRHDGGVFVAAHRNRLTVCDRYKPTAVLRSITSVRPINAPIGHPGVQFSNIMALATTATPRVYIIDAAAVLAVDIDTCTVLHCITAADTRLLRQPSAVAVDLVTSSVLVCDATTRRVMQFDADMDAGRRRCVIDLADACGGCVALTIGQRGPDGHQLVYVVYRGHCFAEVHMFQI